MKKTRESNFELMRVVSIIFIILYHTIIHSNILTNSSGMMNNALEFIICLIIIHVNSFVLLTGYFQYNKKFKVQKFWSIFNTMYFYRIVIPIILLILGVIALTPQNIFDTIFPFNNYWFIITYLGLYTLSPFLNKIIEHTSKKEHKTIILLLLIFSSIIPYISYQHVLTNNGFSLISFMYLYLIGAYINKYEIVKWLFNKFSKIKIRVILIVGIIILASLNFSTFIFTNIFNNSNNVIINYINQVFTNGYTAYSNPIIVLQSICYFLLFATLKFKNKFINILGTLPFGIYLIHENAFIRTNLYKWLNIDIINFNSTIKLIIYIIAMTFIIFIICAIIEFIRQKISQILHKKINKFKKA